MTEPPNGHNQQPKADELTPKQAAYVQARLQAKTMVDAAALVGVSDRTARRWEREPRVVLAIRTQRDGALSEAATVAAALMRHAFSQVAAIGNDKTVSPAVRLAAWRIILEQGRAAIESADLVARIEALENANA